MWSLHTQVGVDYWTGSFIPVIINQDDIEWGRMSYELHAYIRYHNVQVDQRDIGFLQSERKNHFSGNLRLPTPVLLIYRLIGILVYMFFNIEEMNEDFLFEVFILEPALEATWQNWFFW